MIFVVNMEYDMLRTTLLNQEKRFFHRILFPETSMLK